MEPTPARPFVTPPAALPRVSSLPAPAPSSVQVSLNPADAARVKRSESLLRVDQVEKRTGFKKSKLYAMAKEEPLLRPVRISSRCVAWPESRIDAFIAKVIARADAQAGLPTDESPQA